MMSMLKNHREGGGGTSLTWLQMHCAVKMHTHLHFTDGVHKVKKHLSSAVWQVTMLHCMKSKGQADKLPQWKMQRAVSPRGMQILLRDKEEADILNNKF